MFNEIIIISNISPLKYDFYKFDNQFLIKCISTTRDSKNVIITC